MRLFLSYPSVQRPLAERLALALEHEGHDVFFDRHDLDAGESFHGRLRAAVDRAQAMVFLVTPESVRAGSYTLTELGFAQQRWPRPSGHVLPVMVAPTPIAALPAYLSAVTLLQPQGEPVAETVAAVARLDTPLARRWGPQLALVAVLLAATALALWGYQHHRQSQAEAQARVQAEARLLAQATAARELCFSGGHAVALGQLSELSRRATPALARLDEMLEECAMFWLRDMRATAGKSSFAEQVAQVQPVLLAGLAVATGARAADLRAHLGWGEYLRSREGAQGLDPVSHWKRALADEADNVYAQAMWARWLLDRRGGLAEARERFTKALSRGTHTLFVRGMQFGGTVTGNEDEQAYALTVLDSMRRNREILLEVHRDRLWRYIFSQRFLDDAYRERVAAALPPGDLLLSFDWAFPPATVPEDRRLAWRFARAALQARAGEPAAARAGLAALASELRASGRPGSLLDATQRLLSRLP